MAIYLNFNQETTRLLSNRLLKLLSKEKTTGDLKILCDMIKTYELEVHSEEINDVILNKFITYSDNTKLLKIKFDSIINGQCSGKRLLILKSVLALLFALAVSMPGTSAFSIGLFLKTLRNLLEEGKISKALYMKILKAFMDGRGVPVPLEELEQFLEL